jgi:hypothetical protein
LEVLVFGVIAICVGFYRRKKWLANETKFDALDAVEPISYGRHMGSKNIHYIYYFVGGCLIVIFVLAELGVIPKG